MPTLPPQRTPLIVHMAKWITTRDSNWSDAVDLRTRHGFADTIACMVAGTEDVVVAKALQAVERWSSGKSSAIGTSHMLAATEAALVNATAAHVLEIDDNYYPALTHASAVIVPALLALAEEIDANGSQLIDAYIVGLELHALLGRGVNRSHYFVGWHPTATIGCIGTAGACARLLNLSMDQTISTLSIAASMASGNKAQFGTEVKALQCGIGASNAVRASYLGQAGIQGNPDVMEDPQGFLSLYGGPNPRGWSEPLKKLDNPLAMEEFGLAPKRHACCGSAHNTLDSIIQLKQLHGFSADDIKSISVLVGSSNRKNLKYDEPVDEFQARFSMNYNVALILLYGKVTLSDFTTSAVQREEVRKLLRITKTQARNFADEPVDPDDRPAHEVEIELKSGQKLTASRVYAKGLIQDPFTDQERIQKIVDCCEPVIGTERLNALIETLKNLPAVKIRSVTELLKKQ